MGSDAYTLKERKKRKVNQEAHLKKNRTLVKLCDATQLTPYNIHIHGNEFKKKNCGRKISCSPWAPKYQVTALRMSVDISQVQKYSIADDDLMSVH